MDSSWSVAPPGARFDRISISLFEDRGSPLATKPRRARFSGLARQNDPVKNRPASVSYPPPLPPARAIPGAPLLSAAASLRGRVQILVKSGFWLAGGLTACCKPPLIPRLRLTIL